MARAAGPGDLDPSFNGTGVVTTSISSNNADFGRSIAIQPDGKIVVVGESRVNSGFASSIAVVRYREDGSLDSSFNGAGIITTAIESISVGNAVAIQNDKIVIAGYTDSGSSRKVAVARYNETGGLDTSFNGTGVVTTSIGASAAAFGVAVHDDKILVAGSSNNNSGNRFTVIRYNSNGSLDTSFGGTGIITTTLGTSSGAYALAIQPDGKIVVVGNSNMGGGSFDFTILRYHSNGSLDNTFNGSGIVTTSISTGLDQATSVIIQPPDNKIVVAGQSDALGNPKFAIVRYLNDGKLDTTFNGTGIVTTSIGAVSLGSALISQANGKIVVAGSSSDGQGPQFTLARYNHEGNLDPTFNQTGIVTTNIGSQPSEALSIAIQPDGKLAVAGFTYDFDFAVARYFGDPVNLVYLPTILKNR